MAFTPTAGTLTLTVSGTVTFGMLCKSSVTDRSYQKITDWTTEQYAWAATKNVPWLRRNMLTYTEDFSNAAWIKSNTSATAGFLTESAVTNTHYTGEAVAVVSGVKYIFSVEAKQSTRTGVRLAGSSSYFPASARAAVFNLTDGTIYSQDTGVNATSVLLSDGYYKLSIELTANASGSDGAAGTIAVMIGDGSTLNYAGNGTSGIYVRKAQLSVGTCEYQRIATTWPAEYTSLALAAGYPISLYSDRAGTTATVGPDDPVGVLLDQSEGLDTSTRYGSAPGATGDYWSTPSAVANNVLGDIDLRCDVALTSWSSGVAQYLIAKDDTDTNRSYTLYITTGGLLAFYSSVLTGAAPTRSSTVATGIANGVRMWVRCTYASATGDINFYTSTSGISWTKLGGTVNAGSGALPSRSVAVTVGAASGGVSSVAAGRFYRAQVYNGISGSLVVDFDATKSVLPGRFTAATGEVWTGNGKALIVPGGYHATAPSDAARPNLRLDGNGRWYLDRDTTDDNLPITWPTVLSESQLGPEILDDTGFDDDSKWSKSATCSVTGGKGVFTNSPAGSGIYQTGKVTAGKAYRVTYTLTLTSTGTFTVYLGVTGAGAARSASGTYSEVIVAGSTNNNASFASTIGGLNIAATIDNVSVREVTGTNVIYTATGDYTTKDSGLILSGATDYKFPQRPSGDYGRIVMASESKYDAKIIKYLDQKRGRAYQLGPELVSNGGFDTDLAGWGNTSAGTSSWGGGEALCATVSNGVAGGITQALTLTVGKSYLVTASLRKVSGDGVTIYITNNALSAVVATGELIAQSTMRTTSLLFAATETNNRIYCRCAVAAGTGASGYFDNVSVREILL
jgi:hypothetical protein